MVDAYYLEANTLNRNARGMSVEDFDDGATRSA
jgi:hypothetical protein